MKFLHFFKPIFTETEEVIFNEHISNKRNVNIQNEQKFNSLICQMQLFDLNNIYPSCMELNFIDLSDPPNVIIKNNSSNQNLLTNNQTNCCQICQQKFKTPQALGGHMSKKHNGSSSKYQNKIKIQKQNKFNRKNRKILKDSLASIFKKKIIKNINNDIFLS